ncbi:MAG: hypothetical protein VX498_06550 [Myxococcota bacterium]|nr:hypothetical protein [Myxococcota bacterium]
MHPRLLVFCVLAGLLGVLPGCKDTGAPEAEGVSGPWSASDYRLTVEASHQQAQAGEAVLLRPQLLDPLGSDVTDLFDISTHITPALGVLADGDHQYRFTDTEPYTFIASTLVLGATLVASAELEILAGDPANLTIEISPPVVAAGNPVTVFAEITDAFGNPATGEVAYSVSPNATVDGDFITATALGSYVVTGSLIGSSAEATDDFSVEAGAPASLSISLSSYDVERGDGVFVTSVVLDEYGNPSDYPVELSADGSGAVAWADYVRFEDEGIFTVAGDIFEYGLHDEDGPVLVDSSGPQIRVTTPQRGVEIPSADGPTVMVTGSVTDPWTGVSSVQVNGEPALLFAGGIFEYVMEPTPGLNEVDVVAIDGDGNISDHFQTYLWGDFQPVGTPHDDGILARLNEGAIDVMEDLLADELTGGSLTSGLVGNLYTSPNWCIGVSWLAQVCGQVLVDLEGVSMSSMDFDLDPHAPNSTFANGYLAFGMEVDDFLIELDLTGIFSGNFLFWSWSNSLNAGADLGLGYMDLDTQVGLFVNPSNEIEVTLANTSTDIDDIDIDIDGLGIFGELLGLLSGWLANLFEPIIEGLLPPLIESVLPDALEDALADLEIATSMDLMGASLDIEALPGFIEIDDDGITLALDSSAVAELGPTAPATLGSWYEDSPIPTYGATPDFALSLSDKFTNQLLHAVWQAGVIDFSMDAAELGLDLGQVTEILPLTEISVQTLPLLPPVVGPSPSSGLLELGLGDMLVNVYGDPGGNTGLMMQLAVSLWADAELSIDGDGLIQFGLGDPVVVMDYVTSDWAELNGEVVEDLMDSIVDLLVPEITGALDEIGGIPMPELGGLGLSSPAVYREPVPVNYITAEGGLVLIP